MNTYAKPREGGWQHSHFRHSLAHQSFTYSGCLQEGVVSELGRPIKLPHEVFPLHP